MVDDISRIIGICKYLAIGDKSLYCPYSQPMVLGTSPFTVLLPSCPGDSGTDRNNNHECYRYRVEDQEIINWGPE